MENSLYELHEYQVDGEITKSHSKADYSYLLVHLIWNGGGSLVNNFNQSQIKNRIMMMAQTKSNLKEKFKFLLMLPLLGLLIVLFSCEQQEEALPAPPPPPMEVFDVVENMPKPAGGLEGWNQYLANNLKYPIDAKKRGITGTVYLTFIVDTEGSLQNVEILKGVASALDEEAIKTVKNSPKWEPGTQRGQKVNVKMRLPIRFGIVKGRSDNNNIPNGHFTAEEVDQINNELKVDANYANGVWSGIVRDPDGNKLPGATIVLAGTYTGTVSGTDGRFSIKTSQSGNLYVNFKGYKSVWLNGK